MPHAKANSLKEQVTSRDLMADWGDERKNGKGGMNQNPKALKVD